MPMELMQKKLSNIVGKILQKAIWIKVGIGSKFSDSDQVSGSNRA